MIAAAVQPPQQFPLFKTITLGTYKTPDEYRTALKKAGVRINPWANEMLSEMDCVREEREVNLASVFVAELGFRNHTRYRVICAKAAEMGLAICPAEVGPVLWLAYTEQPHSRCTIVMQPLLLWEIPLIFEGGHNRDGLWLGYNEINPDDMVAIEHRFVFVRPA